MREARSHVWQAVREERRALVADLEDLGLDRWGTPSWCSGWDVHDVVAHLVDSACTTRLGFLRRMTAARFDFDRDNAVGVLCQRQEDPRQTLERLRAVVERTTTPPAPLATRLVEAIVHGEDIRGPLGMTRDYPAAPVVTALSYQVRASVAMGGGKERAQGWRLTASDVDFAHGSGPEVSGPALLLLLAVSQRPVPGGLTGAGAARFAETLNQ